MATLNKLTAMRIKKAAPGEKLEDGGGLRFVSGVSGGKWVFRYSFGGKRREMGLGGFDDLPLAEARKLRAKWTAALKDGKDPLAERQRQIEEEAAAQRRECPTFADMVQIAFDARKGILRDDGKAGRWLSPLEQHVIPKIGKKSVTDLTQADIHAALLPIWHKKHPTAVKAINRIKIIITHARLSGYDIDPFICDAARHMLGHVNHKVQPIPATSWRDVPALYARLNMERSPHFILRFAILTAMRSHAVLGARFDEIEGDIWTVPAGRMKGKEGTTSDFRVPLSSEALAVVQAARKSSGSSDLLFPSRWAGKRVVEGAAVAKVLNDIGEEGRLHGFRTSFRTWVQDTEAASYDVAETSLAHILGGKVERSYARSDLLEKRRVLMQKWADFVTQSEAKVVKLRV